MFLRPFKNSLKKRLKNTNKENFSGGLPWLLYGGYAIFIILFLLLGTLGMKYTWNKVIPEILPTIKIGKAEWYYFILASLSIYTVFSPVIWSFVVD